MPAITEAHTHWVGCLDNFACPFIIKHVKRLLVGEGRFMDKCPAELCFSFGKQFSDEVFFHIQILVKQFAQYLLIQLIPQEFIIGTSNFIGLA